MEEKSWADLPDHIIVSVLSYLRLPQRSHVSLVCKSWHEAFCSPFLWHSFRFTFTASEDFKYQRCLDKLGQYFRRVEVCCDQAEDKNRQNACRAIEALAKLKKRRVEHISIRFIGENPLFYAGKEFIRSLKTLFGPVPEGTEAILGLKSVDLRKLSIAFEDDLFHCLVENNFKILEELNIQNASLVCKVTSGCILKLVQKCRKLICLATHYGSITEDILLAFTEDERSALQNLSILCRREEKYGLDISSKTWTVLKNKLPGLKVNLAFDSSCPMFKVNAILKPEIPVSDLRLEVQARLVCQVYFAAEHYSGTLETLSLSTTNSPELENALIHLVTACTYLRQLYVFQCYISQNAKTEILKRRPELKRYLLKTRETDTFFP
ncbi:predicted protein [Nematostella vectensis]|uniref:F-box/LRR-repeat protein 8 n=1 Tax=Nematostella vectensis TaxID=45351 RepID=A7SGI7_NEMVE|nr:F-box/LRR-repeat protein 8 [Nematostella vectensis]EDO37197.1 predicted protein [Nematostella vectensis]|eukprot:XP_001629260.1 predicted protein [Nematostella vectensis]